MQGRREQQYIEVIDSEFTCGQGEPLPQPPGIDALVASVAALID